MSEQTISEMIAHIIEDGRMTNEEKKKLDAFLLSDGQLSVDERKELDKLLALIARGELQVEQSK